MKICYLEDKAIASFNIKLALCEDYDVTITDDFRNVADWISDAPDKFDVIIMDLKAPSNSLRILPTCEDYDDGFHHSPTLYFIERFLKPQFPQCLERIILLSAYFSEFRALGLGEKLDQFVTVDKHNNNAIPDLLSKINAKRRK